MKNLRYLLLSLILGSTGMAFSADNGTAASSNKPLKIAVVNFKETVEKSKLGKKEQSAFEAIKKQMENVLTEKEKALNEIATKLNDPDYLDSLSPEAETELKRKFRAQSQELQQLQGQYYQSLNQTNFRVVQKLNEIVTKAAQEIAKTDKIDLVLNEESAFYYQPAIDISSKVVAMMDQQFDKEEQEAKTAQPGATK